MAEFILRLVINAISLAAAVRLIDGIEFTGQWWKMLIIALIFGFINSFLKPVIKLFSLPLLFLTLGIFTLFINALMLALTAELSEAFRLGLEIRGFWPAFWGALVVSIVSFFLSLFTSPVRS